MSIDINSIISKAKGCTSSGDTASRMHRVEAAKMEHTPEEAAQKFIEVLKSSIASSGLSEGAISAISNLEYSSPTTIGKHTFTIDVNFSGDMSRPSLAPEKYDSIDNLAALFNNGVDHTMKQVHGIWHEKDMWSRTTIPGTHFVENAVNTFISLYGDEYNVIDVSVNGNYT